MAPPSWDPEEQFEELGRRKRHLDSDLTLSGSVLGLVNAILLVELLSVNEDTNTFLLSGLLAITVSVSWLVVARRAGRREMRWERQARVIERDQLMVPESLSLWDEAPPVQYPPWIAVAALLASLVVVWIGLLGYALWMTYLGA